MYDELINKLRIGAKCFPGYELYGYAKEPFRLMPEHLTQAADAIEELLASCDNFEAGLKDAVEECEKVEKLLREEKVDNVNLTGWLAEEHAKHLWIPVTERLPEEKTDCLIFVVSGEFGQFSWISMAFFYNGVFRYDDHWGEFDHITHWMPLPEPPKDGET